VRSTLGFRSRFAREQAIRKGGSGIQILYLGQWLGEFWSAQSIWSILHSEWRFFRIFYSGGNILLRFYAFRSISEISREPGRHEQVVVGGLDDDGLGRGAWNTRRAMYKDMATHDLGLDFKNRALDDEG
jgi:hypothetical protein